MPTRVFEKIPEEKRQRIKNAVLDLLKEKPMDKITFKNVADRSGVTRASLYVYFENTVDLFEFVFADIHALGDRKVEELFRDGADLADVLIALIRFIPTQTEKYGYAEIARNMALGIRVIPADSYNSFSSATKKIKAYIQTNFDEKKRPYADILFILFRHALNAIHANLAEKEAYIAEFELQAEALKPLLR